MIHVGGDVEDGSAEVYRRIRRLNDFSGEQEYAVTFVAETDSAIYRINADSSQL